MFVDRTAIKNLIFIRLNPGDDILASIEKAAKENHIENAVILSGVGSARSHHYHVVASRVVPPLNLFTKGEKASDIVNIDGFIIKGRVHAHIIHSDTDIAFGGHLESGVEVLTFVCLTLAEVDYDFTGFDKAGNIEDFIPDRIPNKT
ncbi:MAG: DNA-binding protein [Treponema sp.]|nr:DNA-binding protein [Treponema sp.]